MEDAGSRPGYTPSMPIARHARPKASGQLWQFSTGQVPMDMGAGLDSGLEGVCPRAWRISEFRCQVHTMGGDAVALAFANFRRYAVNC